MTDLSLSVCCPGVYLRCQATTSEAKRARTLERATESRRKATDVAVWQAATPGEHMTVGQNDDWDEPEVQVFYADPVDADGNVIGTVNLDSAKVHCSWTDSVRVTKVPASEIVLDPETTIYAKVPERKDDDAKS